MLPPRVRTWWTRCGANLVIDDGRPKRKARFFLVCGRLPPVARRLCSESREIPMANKFADYKSESKRQLFTVLQL